jgi:hypothetical protein
LSQIAHGQTILRHHCDWRRVPFHATVVVVVN